MKNQKKFEGKTPDQEVITIDKRHTAQAPVVQPGLPATIGPMEIMMEAVQRNQGKEVLEQLQAMFEFQKQIDAEEARKAYYRAVAEFKRNAPDIMMDKINKQTGNSPYSSTGNFLRTVNPVLGEYGLSANFKIDDTTNEKLITVTCVQTHELGHSDSSSMSAEPDTLGPKGTPNKTMIHGRMSTLTQLMRATFSSVTGLAAISEKYDDDGNAAGGKVAEFITKEQVEDITKRIKKLYGEDDSMFMDWIKEGTGAETIDTIPAKFFDGIIRTLKSNEKSRQPGQEG